MNRHFRGGGSHMITFMYKGTLIYLQPSVIHSSSFTWIQLLKYTETMISGGGTWAWPTSDKTPPASTYWSTARLAGSGRQTGWNLIWTITVCIVQWPMPTQVWKLLSAQRGYTTPRRSIQTFLSLVLYTTSLMMDSQTEKKMRILKKLSFLDRICQIYELFNRQSPGARFTNME